MRPNRTSLIAIFVGVLIAVATGCLENPPGASIIGATYFGYPFVWRVTLTTLPSMVRLILPNLVGDMVVWAGVLYGLAFARHVFQGKSGRCILQERGILALLLVLPLGFVMGLVHELGHVAWGTVVGGNLTYMQVAFLVLYPRFAVTSEFVLGLVRVDGLTGMDFGVFLLGGAITTNIVSWLVGLFLLRRQLAVKTRLCCKLFGLFGLLDLPLYVLLPQLGFRHWLVVGVTRPEPLIGARLIGLPDPIFYVFVVFTSLGLVTLYSQSVRSIIHLALRRLSWR